MRSYSPAMGLVGTVVGLIFMLETMSDPSTIGPAMAVALTATFYGVVSANLLFLPLSNKLKERSKQEVLIREMERDRKIVKLDLRSKSIFSSPYYYIRQNDIIYVTPSDRKINMRSESAQYYAWGLSGLSLLIAVIAISL